MLTGTASIDELSAHISTLESFDTPGVSLRDVEVLQSLFEIRIGGRQACLPSGLHPTNPPTFIFQFWNCPDSEWGPFRLAQGRVGCRSGLRPRGLVQGCVCDNAAAVNALRTRWGLPARLGDVTFLRRYDAVTATARVDGVLVAALTARDAEPLGPDDVAYTTSVALAETPRGRRLVQIDTDLHVERAERVKPTLEAFDAPGWVHASVQPYHAVSASIAVATIDIRPLRFVSKADELAFSGTESVGGH